jgi:hypothetical protein
MAWSFRILVFHSAGILPAAELGDAMKKIHSWPNS